MDFKDREYDVFRMFNDRWALATAGTIDDYNTMTIAWGSMGTIWGPPHGGKPILTIYVSPARYTFEYLEKNDYSRRSIGGISRSSAANPAATATRSRSRRSRRWQRSTAWTLPRRSGRLSAGSCMPTSLRPDRPRPRCRTGSTTAISSPTFCTSEKLWK